MKIRSTVILLLLLLGSLTSAVWGQICSGITPEQIKAGVPYRIVIPGAEGAVMALDKPDYSSITYAVVRLTWNADLSKPQNFYGRKDEVFYFERVDGTSYWYLTGFFNDGTTASPNYVKRYLYHGTDGNDSKLLMSSQAQFDAASDVNKLYHRFQVVTSVTANNGSFTPTTAGTDYVFIGNPTENGKAGYFIAPGRGFTEGSGIFADILKNRFKEATKALLPFKIVPWDPLADLKNLIDKVEPLYNTVNAKAEGDRSDDEKLLHNTYNTVSSTYTTLNDTYRSTSKATLIENATFTSAVSTAVRDLQNARRLYLSSLSLPADITTKQYRLVHNETGKALTWGKNGLATVAPIDNSDAQVMTFEAVGTAFYLKSNGQYLRINGNKPGADGNKDKGGANYDTNNDLQALWSNTKDARRQINILHMDANNIGIQFEYHTEGTYGGLTRLWQGRGYLAPTCDATTATMQPFMEDGITNPHSYWRLEELPERRQFKYHIVNTSRTEVLVGNFGVDVSNPSNDITLPEVLQSPLAENYTFYSDAACTSAVNRYNEIEETSGTYNIYVKYTVKSSPDIIMNGEVGYTIKLNSKALKDNGSGTAQLQTTAAYTDDFYWTFDGDPYHLSVKNVQSGKYLYASNALNSSSDNISLATGSASATSYWMLLKGDDGQYRIVHCNKTPATDNYYYILHNPINNNNLRLASNDYVAGQSYASVQATIAQELVYQVINLSYKTAITATVTAEPRSPLAIPDIIKSPLATGFTYWKTKSGDEGSITLSDQITNADQVSGRVVYVKYSYDNDTSPVDLNCSTDFTNTATNYNIATYSNGTDDYYMYYNNNYNSGEFVTKTTYHDDLKSDNYLFRLTGNDPYNVQIINKTKGNTYSLGAHTDIANIKNNQKTHDLRFLDNSSATTYFYTFAILPGDDEYTDAYRLAGTYVSTAYGSLSAPNRYWYLGHASNTSGSGRMMRSDGDAALYPKAVNLKIQPNTYVNYEIVRHDGSTYAILNNVYAPLRLSLPENVRSPLADDYRYYAVRTQAESDATAVINSNDGNLATARNHEFSGKPVNGATYYVRYSWLAENGLEQTGYNINLDGATGYIINHYGDYNLQLGTTTAKGTKATTTQNGVTVYQVAANGNYNEEVTEAAGNQSYYEWTLRSPSGKPDPYNIIISSREMGADYFLSSIPGTGNRNLFLWSKDDATNAWGTGWALLTGNKLVAQAYNDNYRYLRNTADNNYSGSGTISSPFNISAEAEVQLRQGFRPITVSFHIMDNQGEEVLIQSEQSSDVLAVPDAIRSPLAVNWRFYKDIDLARADATAARNGDPRKDHTQSGNVTRLTGSEANGIIIYCRYSATSDYDLIGPTFDPTTEARDNKNTATTRAGQTYLIEFQNGHMDYQEDRGDKVIVNPTAATSSLYYAQCNGQSQFYVYNETSKNSYFDTGNSARSRLLWYLQGGDPYRLRIISNATCTQAYVDRGTATEKIYTTYNYFTSKATDSGLQTTLEPTRPIDNRTADYRHNVLDDKGNPIVNQGTYYMVLPSGTGMRLVTHDPMGSLVSLAQRTVSTLQHNWKQSPTVEGDAKTGQAALTTAQRTAMGISKGEGYVRGAWMETSATTDAYYSSTVNVGPTFKFVRGDMRPTIHLLDNHGWEVKYWSHPSGNAEQDEILRAYTKKYDSPMVLEYQWYVGTSSVDANAKVTKVSGYYKYTLSEDMEPIHRSTSLTDYPYLTLYAGDVSQVPNNTDYFVTYTVKPQYTDMELQYLIEQNSNLAKSDGANIDNSTAANTIYSGETFSAMPADDLLWHLERNADIDEEMGYAYEGANGEDAKEDIEATYVDEGRNGFDPYNIRIKSKDNSRFLTTLYDNAGNVLTGTGSMELQSTLGVQAIREGNSHNMMQITGATWMFVEDNDGHHRLVPRFEDDIITAIGVTSKSAFALHNLNTLEHATNSTTESIRAQDTRIIPVFHHTLHVVNLDNQIAISSNRITMEELGGVAPTLPRFIGSPFIKNQHFWKTQEAAIARSGEEYDKMPAVAEAWVTYDYDPTTVTQLDLSGKKYYHFLSLDHGEWYSQYSGGVTTTESSDDTDAYLWKPEAEIVNEQLDPYQITLYNKSDANKEHGFGPYIVIASATDGQYELLRANSTPTDYESTYQYVTHHLDTHTLNTQSGTTGDDDIQLVYREVPVNVTYVVINNRGTQSIRQTVEASGGDEPVIPEAIKSAQVRYEDFTYYHSDGVTMSDNSTVNPTGDNKFTHRTDATYVLTGATPFSGENDRLDYQDQTVYVRYEYHPEALPDDVNIDISGLAKYNIRWERQNENYYLGLVEQKLDNNNYGNVWVNGILAETKYTPTGGTETTYLEGEKLNVYIWKLDSKYSRDTPDPYDIQILNNHYTDAYFCSENKESNGVIVERIYNATDMASKSMVTSFIIVPGVTTGSDGHPTLRLMANYTDNSGNLYYAGIQNPNVSVTPNTRAGRMMSANYLSTNAALGFVVDLQFINKDLVNVEYWLKRHIVDNDYQKVAYKENIVSKANVALPTEWQRKYCNYTYRCAYTDGNTVLSTPATNAESVNTLTNYPVVHDEEGNTATIRIYVDYTVSGMPFNLLADTKDGVAKLLNNEENVLETRFFNLSEDDDQTLYAKMNTEVEDMNGTPRKRKDFLYFMVLGTDNKFTSGKQNFLRRESNGRISTLPTGNGYKLHKNDADNLNGWSYSRCAEAYQPNEHAPYEEKNWLFAFAGDPYDLFIYNASAIDEDAYDINTLKSRTKTYHPQHTVNLTTLYNKDTKITEYVPATPDLTAEAPEQYAWGLAESTGSDSDETFSLTASSLLPDATTGQQLLWQYAKSTIDDANEVVLKSRSSLYTGLDYNIQVQQYDPQRYEDINITIRRDDEVKSYTDAATDEAKATVLANMKTGISELYFSASERKYMAGDKITLTTLPLNVRRAFCDYTIYKSDTPFDTEGTTYTIKAGPYATNIQKTTTGTWSGPDENGKYTYSPTGTEVYDEDGKPVWTYTEDGTVYSEPVETGAQSIYVSYKVTSDIFLKTAPTKSEVETMVQNNDHVYFMDFKTKAASVSHHAFFDHEATSRIQTGDLSQKVDKNKGEWRREKKKYNGSVWVDDTTTPYNSLQYRTARDRMVSEPENLKWYFVGDPYKVQVFNTAGAWNTTPMSEPSPSTKVWAANTKQAQLARFSTVESNFQFIIDCVHMRLPNYTNIDNRTDLTMYDELGNELGTIPNRNRNKPFVNDFYWECVPAASSEEGAFALRFKEDNDLLGYRNVYYYLAHDGLTKQYITEGESDKQTYHINLSYDPDNATQSGTYIGYHAANNDNTVIKLVQPVKVYVSAFAGSVSEGNRKTKDELSEYYGLGETVTEVPRHLQRKYVSYSWSNLVLNDANKDSNADCSHSSNTFVTPGKANWVFKRDVAYTVDDLTNTADGKQVHLFSTCANPSTPASSELTWLDVLVGHYNWNNNWMYYDKLNTASDGTENQTERVSNYGRALSDNKSGNGWNHDADGWNDGVKGLHWAFIGDPYNFTIINRRRYEDSGNKWLVGTKSTLDKYGSTANDSTIWVMSLAATVPSETSSSDIAAASTVGHWSLQMWKTGGATDFFLRTASLKTTTDDAINGASGNQTGNYWRMVSKQYTTGGNKYEFEAAPYSLSNKNRYTSKQSDLNYGNYVNNGYGYSSTMNGLGVIRNLVEIRTAVAKDEDKADNDAFDAEVRIYSPNHDLRIKKTGMEIKYDEVQDAIPYSLRRYGCTYTNCYLVTDNDSVLVSDFDGTTTFTSTDLTINGKTFREFIASKKPFHLSYVYSMDDATAQYFTTPSNALTEDYTWMNTYFAWDQKYTGTNVEVEYYEKVFDHYVYNADGKIVDEVYTYVRKTKIVTNPTAAYPTTAFLNSHTNQTSIYADEGTQSESDRQKWALVGDPYSFSMKNYAQYLLNANANLIMNGSSVSSSNILSQAQDFAIMVDKDGKSFLAIIDSNGEVVKSITFDYDTSSDKHLRTQGSGTNHNDPTGNILDTDGVKPFMLANLIRYADILEYHLVIAHRHSLDPEETWLQNLKTDYTPADETDAENAKKANKETLRNHLLEYLKYQEIRKSLTGDSKYLNGNKSVSGDGSTWLDDKVEDIKTLLKQNGTMRDYLSYPIADYSVSRVGIGNHPQVPWYMKRQFCKYYLYQRDVMRSQPNPNDPYIIDNDGVDCYVWVNESLGVQETLPTTNTTHENDPNWYKSLNIQWVSIRDMSYWDIVTDATAETDSIHKIEQKDVDTWGNGLAVGEYRKIPRGYNEVIALNGTVLDKLQEMHYNRKVLIDVVYEVLPETFQFAYKGRNTTAWYTMMTNNAADGLLNFSYKDGIGARPDRTTHYTNNYLWAPEGDPYGFLMRSRYATINGSGWRNVAMTTKGKLPKKNSSDSELSEISELSENSDSKYSATYTNQTAFDDKRIIHSLNVDDDVTTKSDGPSNAVYEMFTGDAAYGQSFLLHPTSAYIDVTNSDFESYYMTHETATHKTKLVKSQSRTLQLSADANWRLLATPDQLLPYFERAGYVGGLEPSVAQSYTNQDYYNLLQNAKTNGTQLDFATTRKIQELVYSGTFYDNAGTEVTDITVRPAASLLPMTFKSTNLVNMADGYYRIKGFSLPRYVSGYRFKSELTNSKPLRFFEKTKDDAWAHTFADLTTAKGFSDATPGSTVLQGNIELLPADFDPSSIFRFAGNKTNGVVRYTLSTQGLNVQGSGTPTAETPAATSMSTADGTNFRLDDIGGATVTLRTLSTGPTGSAWDTEVLNTIKTNYLTSNGDDYSLSIAAGNELNQTSADIQDTKWLLQPVGIREEWPYNEMPLRVEVNKGGVDRSGNEDKYYYGSLYVPFDTRLGNTTDAAFTLTGTVNDGTLSKPGTTTMASVSQLNEMGNPQFVPAAWPVVIRTNNANNKVKLVNTGHTDSSPNVYAAERHYVNMYIPNVNPTTVSGAIANIKLSGEYLEQTLTDAEIDTKTGISSWTYGRHVMVFGLPFTGHTVGAADAEVSHHEYDNTKQVGFFTNDNWAREDYSGYKAHTGSYPSTATVATDGQRSNMYVYHNKIFYVYDYKYTAPSPAHYSIAIFDETGVEELPFYDEVSDDVPWPCDVYDLAGRKVASQETPATLLHNHPSLPKGVYIFGGRKMIIK